MVVCCCIVCCFLVFEVLGLYFSWSPLCWKWKWKWWMSFFSLTLLFLCFQSLCALEQNSRLSHFSRSVHTFISPHLASGRMCVAIHLWPSVHQSVEAYLLCLFFRYKLRIYSMDIWFRGKYGFSEEVMSDKCDYPVVPGRFETICVNTISSDFLHENQKSQFTTSFNSYLNRPLGINVLLKKCLIRSSRIETMK